MDIVQLVALAVGILALVWHQQRSITALRAEMREDSAGLRVEMREDSAGLRVEMREEFAAVRVEMREEFAAVRAEIAAVREAVVGNSQRLSRIEGFLGIGMPAEVAASAPDAGE